MRRLSQLSLVLGLLLWGPSAYAQSVRYQSQAISSRGAGIANATIAVCTQPANTNTQPCSPLATLATSTSTTSGGANPLTADSFGNFFFYAAPGRYTIQIFGPAVFGQFVTVDIVVPPDVSGPVTLTGAVTMGNGNSFAPVTFSNHNNSFWAGPGATPTIDQAVTACGALPGCQVFISPGYTGVESVNLISNSMGYLVYVGANNITVHDYRSCQGTPGNGFACPIYGTIFGGRLAGQRNRTGVSYVSHNETDSAFGSNAFVWIDGTIPSNGGGLGGNLSAAEVHDSITVGASTSEIAASANEVDANATSADNPLYSVYGVVSGVNFTRVAAAQNIIVAKAFGAKTCSNGVSAPAKFFYCYGFHAEPQTGGTYRNFGFHTAGDMLFENSTRIFASTADTSVGVTATSSGQTGTFTMASNCAANPTFVAGALVAISGMNVAGYNNSWVINANGCSGSSWSTFMPGTNNLAAGSGGTAQTTTPTVTTSFGFGGTNNIIHQPLADASGWKWQTKAGVDMFRVNTSGVLAANAGFGCINAGTCYLGSAGTEPGGAYLAGGANPGGRAGDAVIYPSSTDGDQLFVSYNNGTFTPLVTAAPCFTSQKTESAADTNVLTCTPVTKVGSYRIRFVMSVSAANAATLGWTATYTDSNGNAQTPTNMSLFQTGVAAPALTFTTSAAGNYYGYADVDINSAGTNIVIKLTFSGTSFTAKVSATVERII